MNTQSHKRIAEISSWNGRFFVVVESLMQEGHYSCISHPPFGKRPEFPSLEKARDFVASFGVRAEAITEKL